MRRPGPTGAFSDEPRRDDLAVDAASRSSGRGRWRGRPRRAARRPRAAPCSTISPGGVSRSRTVSTTSRVGSGAGAGSTRRASSTVGSGAEVEQHGGDVDAGDAVGERVVRLVDQADVLAAVDALDEPQLPQRAVAVEHLHHEPLGELEQLAPAARARAAR